MAVSDIAVLETELPHLFDRRSLPGGWEDDWIVIPINDPESYDHVAMEADIAGEGMAESVAPLLDDRMTALSPAFGDGETFPGQPQGGYSGGLAPPPDAFAFYLPFHYFFPTWWGVYLLVEGVSELAGILGRCSNGRLASGDAIRVARIFLYGHEQFHHIVESFATRLEISHRIALYRDGFERFYREGLGTDNCLEEALATAHGLRRVRARAFDHDPQKTKVAVDAVTEYVCQCPPGYRLGADLAVPGIFEAARNQFAEENLRVSVGQGTRVNAAVWKCFPHAFSGIARVKSRVNYIVQRDSLLARRQGLAARYMTYRVLAKKLEKLAGCRVLREGKGSHVIWQSPTGTSFSIPRHPGDLRKGTLKKIVQQAGLAMPLSEFLATRP